MTNTTAIVLAAGKGTRMKSDLPKVVFPVLGRPMIHWVLDALEQAGINETIVVVGYRDDLVREALAGREGVQFVLQTEQLGTGHAVQMCRSALESSEAKSVMVVAGDSPLIQAPTIERILGEFHHEKWDCLLGTLLKSNPFGLGRIVRDEKGIFDRIVEEKDATEEIKQIQEVNMSTYVFNKTLLLDALSNLKNNNAQSEYYLTDCPAYLKSQGKRVEAKAVLEECESLSINTVDELAIVEAKMRELGYPCAN